MNRLPQQFDEIQDVVAYVRAAMKRVLSVNGDANVVYGDFDNLVGEVLLKIVERGYQVKSRNSAKSWLATVIRREATKRERSLTSISNVHLLEDRAPIDESASLEHALEKDAALSIEGVPGHVLRFFIINSWLDPFRPKQRQLVGTLFRQSADSVRKALDRGITLVKALVSSGNIPDPAGLIPNDDIKRVAHLVVAVCEAGGIRPGMSIETPLSFIPRYPDQAALRRLKQTFGCNDLEIECAWHIANGIAWNICCELGSRKCTPTWTPIAASMLHHGYSLYLADAIHTQSLITAALSGSVSLQNHIAAMRHTERLDR
jgi:hypothetical protein